MTRFGNQIILFQKLAIYRIKLICLHSILINDIVIKCVYRTIKWVYRTIKCVYSTIKCVYRTIKWVYRTIKCVYRTIKCVYRTIKFCLSHNQMCLSHNQMCLLYNQKCLLQNQSNRPGIDAAEYWPFTGWISRAFNAFTFNAFLLPDVAMFSLFICVTQDGWMEIFEAFQVILEFGENWWNFFTMCIKILFK